MACRYLSHYGLGKVVGVCCASDDGNGSWTSNEMQSRLAQLSIAMLCGAIVAAHVAWTLVGPSSVATSTPLQPTQQSLTSQPNSLPPNDLQPTQQRSVSPIPAAQPQHAAFVGERIPTQWQANQSGNVRRVEFQGDVSPTSEPTVLPLPADEAWLAPEPNQITAEANPLRSQLVAELDPLSPPKQMPPEPKDVRPEPPLPADLRLAEREAEVLPLPLSMEISPPTATNDLMQESSVNAGPAKAKRVFAPITLPDNMPLLNDTEFPTDTPFNTGTPLPTDTPLPRDVRSSETQDTVTERTPAEPANLFPAMDDGVYPDPPPMQLLDSSSSPNTTSTRTVSLPDGKSTEEVTLPSNAEPEDAFRPERNASDSAEGMPESRDQAILDETKDDSVDEKEERGLFLQSARNAVQLKRNDLAAKRFTEYLRRYPNDGIARSEFAGLLSSLGRTKLAAVHLEHLRAQFPGSLSSLRLYADLQLQLKQYPKAEAALNQLLVHRDHQVQAAIDLARVYAGTNRRLEAVRIYEELLRFAGSNTFKRKMDLAELLMEIQRPAEALALLHELHAMEPVNLKVMKLMVLASARMGNGTGTYEYIAQMQGIEPENISTRYELADQLFGEHFFRETILVDQQIFNFEPNSTIALVRSATCNLHLFETGAAKALLDSVRDGDETPHYWRAMAEYHSLVGEHADALAICHRILFDDPSDLKTQMTLGHAYLRSRQLERSINAFAGVANVALEAGVEDGPQLHIEAVTAHARSLAEARRFGEATAVLDVAEVTEQTADSLLDAFIDVHSKARQYGKAIESTRLGIRQSAGNHRREFQLRARLGVLLARNGEYANAIQELNVVEEWSKEPLPEAVYGKYQAYKMLGNANARQQALTKYLGPLSSDSYLQVRVAELASEDCDCCLAREMLLPLEGFCDGNPLVANRLGEACLMCSSCEATPNCAGYFQRALQVSPSNVQALLGLARTHARLGEYEVAKCNYDIAARYMFDDMNLQREIARMMGEWQGPKVAQQYYQKALQLTSTDHVMAAARDQPERLAELESEYASRLELGSILGTEMQGKWFVGWSPLSAQSSFHGLYDLEPHNQDAVFEVGQAYSHFNRTHCAISEYERLLCMNPCHREARIAWERNKKEISPQWQVFSRARSQRGRDDLATIDLYNVGTLLQFPFGDEDEFVQVGYSRAAYMPPSGAQLNGNIATGRIQWKPYWPLLLFAHADYETYTHGFNPRVNYDIGGRYQYVENAAFRVKSHQENVILNRTSIARDIHRYGVEIGHEWRPAQPFEIDMIYRYWEYSDDNAAHEAGIHTGYQFTYGRKRMRWLTDFDWMTYREAELFVPADISKSIHPYFAPRDFWFLTGGLECRQYFGCDIFKGANVHWIQLYMGGRADSSGVGYLVGKAEYVRDYNSRITMSGYLDVIQSSVYDVVEGGMRMTARY